MKSLYELDAEIDAIWHMIDASESDEIPEDLDKQLEELELEKEQKLENICKWRANLLGDIDAFKLEEKRIAEQRKSKERLAEKLKDILGNQLGEGNKGSFGTFSLSWRKSQRVVVTDESLVPDDYAVYKRDINKTELKKALASGEVPGAEIETAMNLQIK